MFLVSNIKYQILTGDFHRISVERQTIAGERQAISGECQAMPGKKEAQ